MEFAGLRKGRCFRVSPAYVDEKLPPGRSPIPPPSITDWFVNALTCRHLWGSPNTVWALFAIALYVLFPYDLSPSGSAAASPISTRFFAERFPIWAALTFGYTGFFHVALYGLGWASRPFATGRVYNWDKIAHNLAYSLSGVAIWTVFENVFAFLWATGRLAYISDAEALTYPLAWPLLFALWFIPVWRDAHFYTAHRLLHFRPLYIQVHSLHHRNTDVEPFSGLTMHPIEHLYYYACVFPSLFMVASPFLFLWNGVHLLLSPGASHSGWEDAFQSDFFHYAHHRLYSVNFAGLGAAALDVMFGTFVDKLRDGDNGKARADAKSTLRSPPAPEFVAYMTLAGGCLVAWALAANNVAFGKIELGREAAFALSFLAGFGPVLIATAMSALSSAQGAGDNGTPMFPKGKVLESVIHMVVGTVMCSVPVTWACYLALARPAL